MLTPRLPAPPRPAPQIQGSGSGGMLASSGMLFDLVGDGGATALHHASSSGSARQAPAGALPHELQRDGSGGGYAFQQQPLGVTSVGPAKQLGGLGLSDSADDLLTPLKLEALEDHEGEWRWRWRCLHARRRHAHLRRHAPPPHV